MGQNLKNQPRLHPLAQNLDLLCPRRQLPPGSPRFLAPFRSTSNRATHGRVEINDEAAYWIRSV